MKNTSYTSSVEELLAIENRETKNTARALIVGMIAVSVIMLVVIFATSFYRAYKAKVTEVPAQADELATVENTDSISPAQAEGVVTQSNELVRLEGRASISFLDIRQSTNQIQTNQ